ncbi:hypothetical protein D3C72_1788830 [compost metagenome]
MRVKTFFTSLHQPRCSKSSGVVMVPRRNFCNWSRFISVFVPKVRRNWRVIGSALTGGGSLPLSASSSMSWLIPTSASRTEMVRPSSTYTLP